MNPVTIKNYLIDKQSAWKVRNGRKARTLNNKRKEQEKKVCE